MHPTKPCYNTDINSTVTAIMFDHIRSIAQAVRFEVQAKAERSEYNPNDLSGWCAIASAQLWRELRANNIDAKLCMAQSWHGCHVFVIVDDHIVDITASQFLEYRITEVLIEHHKMMEHNWFHSMNLTFDKDLDLRAYQLANRWPSSQVAYAKA